MGTTGAAEAAFDATAEATLADGSFDGHQRARFVAAVREWAASFAAVDRAQAWAVVGTARIREKKEWRAIYEWLDSSIFYTAAGQRYPFDDATNRLVREAREAWRRT